MQRKRLSHVHRDGSVAMVDVSAKPESARYACARAVVRISPIALRALKSGTIKKGDALATAQIAGIMAAKRTADLIPLCHPLSPTDISVEFAFDKTAVTITSKVTYLGRTGVEMEALTAAAVAALAIYDMCKALDRGIEITRVRLLEKRGGRSGVYRAARARG